MALYLGTNLISKVILYLGTEGVLNKKERKNERNFSYDSHLTKAFANSYI